MGAGAVILIVMILMNRLLEIQVKNAYGPYKEDKEKEAGAVAHTH
jgi:tetrahydromethanopterin S-methyltransferase subunit E